MLLVLVVVGSWWLRTCPAELVLLRLTWYWPLLVVAAGSLDRYLESGFGDAAQGRYLHTGILALALLALLAVSRWQSS